jgi:4-azaleucine resistance transporter AzlC
LSNGDNRQALRDGFVAIWPLLVGVAPFGLILGVTAAGTAIGGGLGYATSLIIFGGAAQLAVVQLIDVDAAIATIIVTGVVINSRHMMYSAAMTPYFRDFSPRARIALPYLLTDQAFAISILRYQEVEDPTYRRWFYLGTGLSLWVTWQITTAAGVLIGAQVPENWSLDFAVPLVFVALLAVAVISRPKAVAALVGGVAAVVAQDAPYQLWMIIGALAGVMAGIAAERLQK